VSHLEQMQASITALDEAHEKVRADLVRRHPHTDPYLMLDENARPILLDSLTALVNARAVMTAIAEAQHGKGRP